MNRFLTPILLALALVLTGAPVNAQDEETPPPATEETPPPAQTQPDEEPLPQGHPPLNSMGEALDEAGNPAVTGSLAIQVKQGTEGGPDPESLPIEIRLFYGQQLMRTVEKETDGYGIAMIENFPILQGMRAQVTVHYADVTYTEFSDPFDPANPNQVMEVNIYDVRDDEPAWEVLNRVVVVHRQPNGINVTENYRVGNPADYTWRGFPDDEGRGNAFSVPLSKNVQGVQLGEGYHDWCCTEMQGNVLVNKNPITPGVNEYAFAYFVPAQRGQVEFTITNPKSARETVLYVPAALEATEVSGMPDPEYQEMGDLKVNVFRASAQPANTKTRIVLTGIETDKAIDAALTQESYAKVAVGVGLGVLVIVAVVIFLMKKPTPA